MTMLPFVPVTVSSSAEILPGATERSAAIRAPRAEENRIATLPPLPGPVEPSHARSNPERTASVIPAFIMHLLHLQRSTNRWVVQDTGWRMKVHVTARRQPLVIGEQRFTLGDRRAIIDCPFPFRRSECTDPGS